MAGQKKQSIRFWTLKIFIITLLVSGGISLIAEVFMGRLHLVSALLIVAALILLGVIFDIIGVACASCDQTPFISMSARKIKKASGALWLLRNAEVVSNVCNDVVGDVCGIVSGAAGAAITAKIIAASPTWPSLLVGIGVSSLIAACTVAGKALGKGFAMRNDVKIVEAIGAFFALFISGGRKQRKK